VRVLLDFLSIAALIGPLVAARISSISAFSAADCDPSGTLSVLVSDTVAPSPGAAGVSSLAAP
jgi:hypothetical protein